MRNSLLLSILLVVCTAEAPAQPSPQPSPAASPAIDTPQVAAEAMQLDQRLRSLPERVVSNEAVAQLEQQITALRNSTHEKALKTEQAIQSDAIFTELQQSSLDWEALNKEVESLSETLTGHATALENELRSLKSDESRWLATLQAAKAQHSPPELIELTSKVVADLSAAVKSTEERRSRIVALQQGVATQAAIITTEIGHLNRAKAESQRSLLEQDSYPLWKVQFGSQADASLGRLWRTTYREDFARMNAFVRARRTTLLVITLITVAALGLFIRVSQGATTEGKEGTDADDLRLITQRPVSLALLVFLVAMMPLLYDAPNSVIGLVNLLGVVPVIRLLQPRLTKPLQRMLLALIASVFLWHLLRLVQLPIWIKRDLLALFTIGVAGVFVWLARTARRETSNQQRRASLTFAAFYGGICLLLTAFLVNLFGYVGLSDLLTQGTLASAYRAVVLYTVVVIGARVIYFILHARTTESIAAILTDRERLARRLSFALGLVMLLVWLHTTLTLFAIKSDVYAAISRALNYQITVGSASFAVGNIVAFVLTLLFGYLLASIIRAILGEGVLPKLKLARGLPNAIATITHYVLLVLIFLFALAAAGVELSKFTLLTGALGVGLGFGLQNVVNNFVSGLILLFERPIRVGDLLEIKGVGGEVTKIGFRSSTVHAFDGSDLIIPNATLISEQVTNWTLTGTRRQVVLNIHVAYDNDPTQVRDLLRATAAGNSGVLDYPPANALFLGFGESSLNFEVRFWAPRPEVVPELKSEVALSIATALNEAGIKVPAPQRLHITRNDEETSEIAS